MSKITRQQNKNIDQIITKQHKAKKKQSYLQLELLNWKKENRKIIQP